MRNIETSSPKDLEEFLNAMNRKLFAEYNWQIISVKAVYMGIISNIDDELGRYNSMVNCGNTTASCYDCKTQQNYNIDLQQAITNLTLAKEFMTAPPIIDNPNPDGIKIKTKTIDWNKPVYTTEEIKNLLDISDTTLRRWINDGWISYSQIDGSDKKYIQKEHLLAFLNNPKIFYPSSK